jgi:Zn-dependent M28 family amino/carboxypeptidase
MQTPSTSPVRQFFSWVTPAEFVLIFAIVAILWPSESWSRDRRRGGYSNNYNSSQSQSSQQYIPQESNSSQPTPAKATPTEPTPAAASGATSPAQTPGAPTKNQAKSILMQQTQMPGKSFSGPLPPLTAHETALRDALKKDVEHLAGQIGERNIYRHEKLTEAARFIEKSLADANYQVSRQAYDVKGRQCLNIEAETKGTTQADEIVIIGAHYDSVSGSPAANDNGSGVAALLALARGMGGKSPERTLRFVAFANEEAPHFQTDAMGSLVYARRSKERGEKIVGMISLETIGYYSDSPKSQKYPQQLSQGYPTAGNFIGFISNVESAPLVKWFTGAFREKATIPSEGAALPARMDGVGWSDQWSFWQAGYPAMMVTDTAFLRYPYYHKPEDTPDKLDYDRMARVVAGLEYAIDELTTVKVSTAKK